VFANGRYRIGGEYLVTVLEGSEARPTLDPFELCTSCCEYAYYRGGDFRPDAVAANQNDLVSHHRRRSIAKSRAAGTVAETW
jgi:hypothetical protein